MQSLLWKNRWMAFKQHRFGFKALVIFALMMFISLLSPLLFQDRPLLIYQKSKLFFPTLRYYPETEFGGTQDLEQDYLSPQFQAYLSKEKAFVIWPLIQMGPETVETHLQGPFPLPPSSSHLFGTDDYGRDMCVRLFYAIRTTVFLSFLLAMGTVLMALAIGSLQGYYGGWIDLCLQRISEIGSSLPILLVLMVVSESLSLEVYGMLIVMILFNWIGLANLVRTEFLRAKQYPYVQSAKALGASSFFIMYRHILPHALISCLSVFPFLVHQSMALLTSLDFLGFGLPVSMISLGGLLQQGIENFCFPWMAFCGFTGTSLILILVLMIGNGIQHMLDPQNQKNR